MKRHLVVACVVLALGCKRQGEPGPPPRSGPPNTSSLPGVGSYEFHLAQAGLYERFQDHRSANEHLGKAADLARSPGERIRAWSAAARLKESSGDRASAIEALERARSEVEATARTTPEVRLPPELANVAVQLARLYAQAGRGDEAVSVCERGLVMAREPWIRDQLLQMLVAQLQRAGTLEAHISEHEAVLVEKPDDEASLRFLAVALAPSATTGRRMGEPPSPPPVHDPSRLVRVLERLVALHPDDAQLRMMAQSQLERAGRTDEAIRIASSAVPASPMECSGMAPGVESPGLRRAADAVRIRARAGQKGKALAEAGNVANLARAEGVKAYILAADLLRELGAPERADKLIARAAQEARTRAERREAALARERALRRAGRTAELKVLIEAWRKSDDGCLRVAAAQRGEPLAMNPGLGALSRP